MHFHYRNHGPLGIQIYSRYVKSTLVFSEFTTMISNATHAILYSYNKKLAFPD
jgi:hypothetical protein